MKKFLTALLAAALCIGVFGTAAAQDRVAPKLKTVQLRWQQYGADGGTTGFSKADTTFLSGATQVVDTTETFDTRDVCFAGPGLSSSATAVGIGRLTVTSSRSNASPNVDSIFVAVDSSVDGLTWTSASAFSGQLAAVAGDYAAKFVITFDSDDITLANVGQIGHAPKVRFRIRVDGNTAAAMAGAKAFLSYYSVSNE